MTFPTHIDVHDVVAASIVVLVTLLASERLPSSLVRYLERFHELASNTDLLLRRLFGWSIWALGLAVAASLLGFGVGPLVTVSGGLLVLGLSLQNALTNMVDGTVLLSEGNYAIGDTLTFPTIGALEGTITDTQVRYTALHDSAGRLLIVPNSTIFNAPYVVTPAALAKELEWKLSHAQPSVSSSPSLQGSSSFSS